MQHNYGTNYFKDKSVLTDLECGKFNRRKKKIRDICVKEEQKFRCLLKVRGIPVKLPQETCRRLLCRKICMVV